MIYTWMDKTSGEQIEVRRTMDDSDVPPTEEECEEEELPKVKEREWIKIVTGGSFTKTFGQKGYW
jgi:hypothetical protein